MANSLFSELAHRWTIKWTNFIAFVSFLGENARRKKWPGYKYFGYFLYIAHTFQTKEAGKNRK